jgi:hypothetical protein
MERSGEFPTVCLGQVGDSLGRATGHVGRVCICDARGFVETRVPSAVADAATVHNQDKGTGEKKLTRKSYCA